MLRQGNCVKHLTGSKGGDLAAPAGQSLLVRRIECEPSSADDYITLSVDRVTIGYWRVQDRSGNHLCSLVTSPVEINLMKLLESKGINVSIPVGEGQTFNVSRADESGNVIVVFDRYDAGDIMPTMPNGSAGKEYMFMQYMNVGTGLTDDGDALFDLSLSPAEFPDFPCGKVVPANTKITLLGLVGFPWLDPTNQSGGFYTEYIKLIREREVLFDEDRNGIPFKSGKVQGMFAEYSSEYSLIGAGHIVDESRNYAHGEPLMFDPPLEFEAGVELNIYVTCKKFGTPGAWLTTVPDMAAILKVVKE